MVTTGSPTGGADFAAKPFAFFRLTHDALRSGLQEAQDLMLALGREVTPGGVADMTTKVGEMFAVVDVMCKIDEESLLPTLAEHTEEAVDIVVDRENLAKLMTKVSKARDPLEKMVQEGREDVAADKLNTDWATLLSNTYAEWRALYEKSLKKKDEITAEHSLNVSPDVYGRAKAVNAAFATVGFDTLLASHVPFCMRQFAHVKRSYGHLRMICSTLQTVTTPREWDEAKPIIQETVGEVNWKQLLKDGMKKPGRLIDPNAPPGGVATQAKDLARRSLRKSRSMVLKARKSFSMAGVANADDPDAALEAAAAAAEAADAQGEEEESKESGGGGSLTRRLSMSMRRSRKSFRRQPAEAKAKAAAEAKAKAEAEADPEPLPEDSGADAAAADSGADPAKRKKKKKNKDKSARAAEEAKA